MLTWDELQQACEHCRKCRLCNTRTNVVFGVGRKNADIMFIGEGPGEQEDLQGVPFVGAAGQLLDDMLSIIDLNRNNTYIANIVKCRPPRNRDPENDEQDACGEYLRKQISLVKPSIIVCLGRVAAKRLIDSDFRITQQHGMWYCDDGIWITAIYHPSALFRYPSKRPATFLDLLEIPNNFKDVHAAI